MLPTVFMDLGKRLMPWLITLVIGLGFGAYGMKRWYDANQGPAKTEQVNSSHQSTTQTNTVTVIKRPDGTTETTTSNSNTTTKDKTVTSTSTTPKAPSKVKVGAQAKAQTKHWKDTDKLDYGPTISVRALGPVWIDAAWFYKSKEVTLGVSWEF